MSSALPLTDFIFHVDLSTTYIVLRRDFSAPGDATGHLSGPLGSRFYYNAASANKIARAHCIREAAKGLSFMSESAVHSEEDELYVGGCVTREEGRDRFEVRVKRLKARGSWVGSDGGGTRLEDNRRGGLAVVKEEDEAEVEDEQERERERSETPTSSLRASTGRRIHRLWSRLKHED